MFAGKKSAQIREILISESAWEEMTCLFAPSLGADVLNEKNESIGTVGQAGQAYVRGVENKGALRVVWGSDGSSSCTVHYQIPENAKKAGLTTILSNQQCQM
ncbi:FimD/PapC C-terminal domain-containing protein [Enterobacter hormaechei subsp. xiangfangensis]